MRKNPFYKFLTEEQRDHKALCDWISKDARTKELVWWHTPNEGRKTPFERYLFSIMGGKRGVSDFVFVKRVGRYSGLVIELKKKGERIFKKNGEPYYPDQHKFILDVMSEGFYGTFAVGFDEAASVLLKYLDENSDIHKTTNK